MQIVDLSNDDENRRVAALNAAVKMYAGQDRLPAYTSIIHVAQQFENYIQTGKTR